ncbi:MAG: ATP-binding protein [Acidobacteriota bacterium]
MKLFLKIFLWFLVAVAMLFGVIIFVTRTFQTEPMFARWQRSAHAQLSVYSGTSVQIYNNAGDSGLREYLTRLRDIETTKEIDIIDENGRAMMNDLTETSDFQNVIEKARTSDTAEIDVSPNDSALGAIPLRFADGKPVILVVRWSGPRAPSLFFDSWLGYMRLAGLLLTAAIVCSALALYLTAPIRRLRVATQKLAGGDLKTRVATTVVKRRDELADLARDFDVMAERIESLITSQQRLTQDVSHELRSPLARMNVALEILKQKSTPEMRPMIDRIETESERLNEMIARILTLAKIESGTDDDYDRRRIDLAELIRDVAADADFEAQPKHKAVEVTAADMCTVIGSDNLLRSAIENVLRNAVRYTAADSTVSVSLAAVNGHAIVKVADHGGGVPEAELANLFRPFYRVGEDRTRRTGGIGLGLAIAQRAVMAHKGEITAANKNGGLEVKITLDTVKN